MPTYVLVARIPAEGIGDFCRYEDAVLPLLAEHGGRLDRRLRSDDGGTEVHLVTFTSEVGFAAYRDDARRAASGGLLAGSGAQTELIAALHDVGD